MKPDEKSEYSASRQDWGFLLALAAGLLALHLIHLHDPLGGFHSDNEAWYASTARNYTWKTLNRPNPEPFIIDYKIRPIYGYLTFFGRHIFSGVPESGRIVTAVFASAALFPLFGIGLRLFGRSTARWAALLFALAPASVMLGRNIQPDMTYVSLMLFAIQVWLIFTEKRKKSLLAWFVVLFALSFLTKNFAAVGLAAVLLHAAVFSVSDKARKNAAIALAVAMAPIVGVALFIKFYPTPGDYPVISVYLKGSTAMPSFRELRYMATEMTWALSPPIAALAVAGVAPAIAGFNRNNALAWFLAAAFGALYFVQHTHSYYLLSCVPFFCLFAGKAAAAAAERWGRLATAVGMACAAFALAYSCLCLGAMKFGQGERFEKLAEYVKDRGGEPSIFARANIYGNYSHLLRYHLWETPIRELDLALTNTDKSGRLIEQTKNSYVLDSFNAASKKSFQGAEKFANPVVGWDFFWTRLVLIPVNRHSFLPGKFLFLGFSFKENRFFGPAVVAHQHSLALTAVPPGFVMMRNAHGGLSIVPEKIAAP